MKTRAFSVIVFIFLLVTKQAFAQNMEDYTKQVFPLNHALNTPIDHLPVHPNSDNIIAGMGADDNLHPDFGTEWNDGGEISQIGIPYNIVDNSQPLVPIIFTPWGSESDPGPWPVPANPYIETVSDWRISSDGDRHMLIINKDSEILYETGNTIGNEDGTEWQGGAGAIFDLTSNDLRPETWTSADAAGLPIFPLLIRYDEVERAVASGGEIPHAIRFTADNTQRAYIWPARHYASSSTNENHPPMGLRFRLKADFNISGYTPRIQAILRTFKKYGLIMSDNGSNWFIQGTHDDRWDDSELGALKGITGGNFEVVDISEWLEHDDFDPNSAAVPGVLLGVKNVEANSSDIKIQQNYPNPFTGSTSISYTLNASGKIRIALYNLLGQEISRIKNTVETAGNYTFTIDSDEYNLQPGIFYCKVIFNNHQQIIKMIRVE